MPVMTKRSKLLRFRSGPRVPLYLFNNIEYLDPGEWKYISHSGSAFALAAKDQILRDAGLESGSVDSAQRFFGFTRKELAEFSCICGGFISNNEMADRIERIAARAA
jgi:hypothetical protein